MNKIVRKRLSLTSFGRSLLLMLGSLEDATAMTRLRLPRLAWPCGGTVLCPTTGTARLGTSFCKGVRLFIEC